MRKLYLVLTRVAGADDIKVALAAIPETQNVTVTDDKVYFEVPFPKDAKGSFTDLTPWMDIAVSSPDAISGLFDPTGVTRKEETSSIV